MGKACITHGRDEKDVHNFWSEILKVKYRQKSRKCEESIRMAFRKIGREILDWMNLARDRNEWWTLEKTVINF
jgi:hypothetical protein